MHNNYYFLKQLSQELPSHIVGGTLIEAFSQSKEELLLQFELGDNTFYIRANLQTSFTCLSFPHSFARQKRNSADIFIDLWIKKVLGVRQFLNERCFCIDFEDGFQLLFKMHGNRSNIILFRQGQAEQLFRSKLETDEKLDLEELDRPISQNFEAFKSHQGNFQALYPTFGPWVKSVLFDKGFTKTDSLTEQWKILSALVSELDQPTAFYIIKTKEGPKLSLIEHGEVLFSTTSAIRAASEFFHQYAGIYFFEQEKIIAFKTLEKLKQRTENYIRETQSKLNDVLLTNYENDGHLIMAYMHQIPNMATEVKLPDFQTGESVVIKLQKDLSPQKNAERYYRKAKNQKLEIARLEDNLNMAFKKLHQFETLIFKLPNIANIKDLRLWIKQENIQSATSEQAENVPYKEFEFEGFRIWVGKNAQSNDELTQRYSYKEDLWLHVRNASGSHVLIKHIAGKVFPKRVIEKAAELAAWYSKRKTESNCPVIVTPKKFVRKPKGYYPGQVKVEKEEVVFVNPKPWQ